MGARDDLLAAEPAGVHDRAGGGDRGAPPPARGAGGRVRERAARRGGCCRRRVPVLDASAPWRRGPRLLPGGRTPHRLQGRQGGARARRRPGEGTQRLPHRFPSPRRPFAEGAGRNGGELRLGAGAAPPGHAAGDPVGRRHARQRLRRDRRGAPVRGRYGQRDRGRAGPKGPGEGHRVLPRRRGGGARGGMSAPPVERRFGPYGGRYVPETLIPALDELEAAWTEARDDPAYLAELDALLRDYVGRPTPLYHAHRLSEPAGGPVWLKREDLTHTGSHKINNAIGQALLAQRMGKPRVIAETGAGQHGVAAATACALLGLDCVVYMGTEDMRRQEPNVQRMRLLGAEVRGVDAGARTLKEAVSAAIRDWVTNVATTHYVIGSCVGPAPYPALVRDLQRRIGDEARAQLLDQAGRLPDRAVACGGGGSNAIGTFIPFVNDDEVELIGVEAAGEGLSTQRHSAPLTTGARGVLHGAMTGVLQDEAGQILEAHSISAGLDYPGVGPEHAWLRDSGRVRYEAVEDGAALDAFHRVAQLEGILPALESSHAIAWALANPSDGLTLITLSGRGDKDLAEVLALG